MEEVEDHSGEVHSGEEDQPAADAEKAEDSALIKCQEAEFVSDFKKTQNQIEDLSPGRIKKLVDHLMSHY